MFDVSPAAGMAVQPAENRAPMRLFWDVCEANEIHPDKVRGPGVFREVVAVRRKIARVLRDAGCSLSEIGRIMNRHHTSVMNLLRG